MEIKNIPFTITNWENIVPTEHKGENGTSFWRIFEENNIRVRMVEYSPNFKSDHYCSRGHVLLVLDGELDITLKDGQFFTLKAGSSFQAEDNEINPHLASTQKGAKVFIVD